MRTFFILLNKELRAYFQSIVAYVVLAAVMLLHGIIFLRFVKSMASDSASASLNQVMLLNIPFWLILILIVPLITMRLFSEEQKLGTLEPLLTAPVQTWQLVCSKYCAALIFYAILYLPCMFYLVYFENVTKTFATGASVSALSSPSFYGGSAMIFLIGTFFVAIGCLASALTSNQIIAAVISFTILLIYFLLGYVRLLGRDLPDITIQFLEHISPIEHMRDYASGLFDTRPVVYYLSFAAFTLALTHQVLDYRKWKV